MVVLVLVVVAAALLTHGVLTERPVEVLSAGVLSALGVVTVLVERRLRNRATPTEAGTPELDVTTAEFEPMDEPAVEAVAAENVDTEVVFVAGRTTFHAPSCTAVEDRIVSVGDRALLERGGMTACRRCLS